MSNFLTVRTASRRAAAVMVGLGLACIGAGAQATLFTGSVYYTHFAGGNNVLRTSFSYDDVSGVVSYGAQTPITNVNGADGIIFAPNGNLIVTSNTTSNVYRINASTGALLQTLATGTPGFPDFHMALDPNNSQFYSSNRYNRTFGPLDTFTINGDGSFNDATTTPILDSATGGLSNVTQIAFAPNGRVMYTDGVPNSNGSIGRARCSPSAACNAAAASGPARATRSNGRPPSSTRWDRRAGPSWRAQSSSASELAGPEPAAN